MSEISDQKALDLAVKYLSFKARTEYEVREYLFKKQVEDSVVETVMAKLKDYRYLDDELYLKNYLETNRLVNRYGSRRMVQDLKKRGLGESLLLVLKDWYPEETEYQCCEAVARKSLQSLQSQTTIQKRKKLYDKLMRLGYPGEMVREVLGHLIAEVVVEEFTEEEQEAEQAKIREKLNRDYEKAERTLRKKGFDGRELTFRIKRTLMGRGYPYELITSKLDEMKEE
jgi:regulatory protein